MSPRNAAVEKTVSAILDLVDRFIAGGKVSAVIPPEVQAVFDESLKEKTGGSVRLATAFFVFYSLFDPAWDKDQVPVGIRGEYGDKLLSAELTARNVTFHRAITAFAENLGTKGNVRFFRLSTDPRFASFLKRLNALTEKERRLLAEHVAWRLFESRAIPRAMPPLPARYLTYARSLMLVERLLRIGSEGHIQQFLVASFLFIHRRRFGHDITTHHPHAADRFDDAVGDIEERKDERLVAAYEVTVRSDWKNRLPDFLKKMRAGKLSQYVIFASDVRSDPNLSPASSLVSFTSSLNMDLAVVDIRDFFSVFCAELSEAERSEAFSKVNEYLLNPRLCGRSDIMGTYRLAVDEWLIASAPQGATSRNG